MKYSERAKNNMTKQVLVQLRFLISNLQTKEKRMERTLRWLETQVLQQITWSENGH